MLGIEVGARKLELETDSLGMVAKLSSANLVNLWAIGGGDKDSSSEF
jgi:hypothetical protein